MQPNVQAVVQTVRAELPAREIVLNSWRCFAVFEPIARGALQ